ncbi:MAG: class I SAM-dependent methyltransferase [Gammaproteobacteria bacterium]|nr:class I SAM-dependent methyltransferase [Gammaproteobacteria bacterium]MBU2067514.1 class I SAM-dependent methyltransferase [Gammaproteobacteria bacterium]MBU2140859.1 class I SAM-dependent methyltransferase [Gammaproteobacteria bacterium]MBU2215411.1 class I SAM-dependent methyltransferase [Gammaproteobacteria bacterium]
MPVTLTAENADALLALGQALEERHYQFVTVTPLTHERLLARWGAAPAENLADIFGWSRAFARDTLDPALFELMQRADVLQAEGSLWRSRVRWSSLDDRLLVHSGFPTDSQSAVFFGPDSYRFVQAIDAHLKTDSRPTLRVADIGCGAGPGALRVAQARPEAEVHALDINPLALAYTAVNARLAGAKQLQIQHSDLLQAVDGEFDLIIANPPYLLDPEQRAYRHGGGELGSGLAQAIIATALERLAPDGSLLLYTGVAMLATGDPFKQTFARLLEDQPFSWHYREVDPDVFGEELLQPAYADAQRIAAVVLTLNRLPA